MEQLKFYFDATSLKKCNDAKTCNMLKNVFIITKIVSYQAQCASKILHIET